VLSVSTNPFTRLGCSLVFWAASAVTVTSDFVFCLWCKDVPSRRGR